MQRGLMHKLAHSSAGKLWDDSNFSSMKMDVYCKDLEEEVDADPEFHFQVKRVAKLWQERWEVPKFSGGRGRKELEAKLEKKYVGLKMDEMEGSNQIFTIVGWRLDGCRHKRYELAAVTKLYDSDEDNDDEVNRDNIEYYAFSKETYACIAEYYKNNPMNDDDVKCYRPEDDCDSDDPGHTT
jgi:hypothetical protein